MQQSSLAMEVDIERLRLKVELKRIQNSAARDFRRFDFARRNLTRRVLRQAPRSILLQRRERHFSPQLQQLWWPIGRVY